MASFVSTSVFVFLLGILTTTGNLTYFVYLKQKSNTLSPFNLLKAILTTTDIFTGWFCIQLQNIFLKTNCLTGIFLLAMVLPNLIGTYYETASELTDYITYQHNSTSSKVQGVAFMFVFLSNLYLLTAVCSVKLYVVCCPLRVLKKKSVVVIVVVSLLLALTVSLLLRELNGLFLNIKKRNLILLIKNNFCF